MTHESIAAHTAEVIAGALATAGGHLSIGHGGFTLHFRAGATLTGYDVEPIKAACLSAGLPVIDSRAVPFDVLFDLVVRGPMPAVGRPPCPPPRHALSYAPLDEIARALAMAGAEVRNIPGIAPGGAGQSQRTSSVL